MNSQRPYFHQLSKFGRVAFMDEEMRIKRKDVDNAVKKNRKSQLREIDVSISKPTLNHQTNFLLRLPAEVRNEIYAYSLGIEATDTSHSHVVRRNHTPRSPNNGTALLRLCKGIMVEARSMFEERAVPYIPIMAYMNFTAITACIAGDYATLSSIESTIFAGLTSFVNAHIHLHINHTPSPDTEDPEPCLDLRIRHIYAVLRQALIIWSSASQNNFPHLKMAEKKRKAIVHLDHLLSDWSPMVSLGGPFNLYHVLSIMSEDTMTEWELHYYIYAGGWLQTFDPAFQDQRLKKTLDRVETQCGKFSNVKLVGEIYGRHQCSFEDRETVTRDITPSSAMWPSWPDDVPWRNFPMVRSDEAMPDMPVTEGTA